MNAVYKLQTAAEAAATFPESPARPSTAEAQTDLLALGLSPERF